MHCARWIEKRVATSKKCLDWYREGDLKRSELNETVESMTCLDALSGNSEKSNQNIVTDERIKENIVTEF